jgi:hypothetical protein
MSISIGNVPGYAEAVAKEGLVRDASFLPINEDIAGYEVRPMSLRHFLILCVAYNPIIVYSVPNYEELSAFLWLLSPQYNASGVGKERFLRRCRRDFVAGPRSRIFRKQWRRDCRRKTERFARLIEAAHSFVREAMQDRPPVSRGSLREKTYYSQATSICATMMERFHLHEQYVLDMPLKRIFQYLKYVHAVEGRLDFLANPSDQVVNEWVKERSLAQ